jgi:hypothetical protein
MGHMDFSEMKLKDLNLNQQSKKIKLDIVEEGKRRRSKSTQEIFDYSLES